jgi:phage terminase small subunit
MAGRITRAQRKFIAYYVEQDFRNATGAYIRAYPEASYDTAKVEASKLLTKPNIQEHMSTVLAEALQREKIPLEKRLFNYWVRRAFYDITEIIDLHGTIKLTEEQLREKGLEVCIDSINRKIDARGHEIITYKFADRCPAHAELAEFWVIL